MHGFGELGLRAERDRKRERERGVCVVLKQNENACAAYFIASECAAIERLTRHDSALSEPRDLT